VEGLYGSAQYRLEVTVAEPELLDEYLAAVREELGPIDVISRDSAPVPGSVESVEVRSQDPAGRYGAPMLRVITGRYPQTADEVALTDDASRLFGAGVGDGIPVGNDRPVVVGIVENPGDLRDEFVLTTSSTGRSPERVTILVDADEDVVDTHLRRAIEPGPIFIDDASSSDKTVYAVLVLTIATIGMLLVGLVASAGFVVIAQRRQRQLGMLGAVGATSRHLRMVVLTNGALVGTVAAVTGIGLGLGAWILFAPAFEGMAGHRISRFDLPWWLIAAGFALAVATASASAWWPARMVSRVPIVNALSGRPPRRVAVHRSALAAVLLLAIGIVCLGLGVDPTRDHVTIYLLIAGVVAMVAAAVLMASPGITVIAARAGGLPVAVRLAVRDLARNRARSGAALSAITVGLAIAVSVVVVAAAAEYGVAEGNLSDRQLIAWVGDTRPDIMVPDRSRAELGKSRSAVEDFASTLERADVVTLEVAIDPTVTERRETEIVRPVASLGRPIGEKSLRFTAVLYVATPELLDHLGIRRATIPGDTILLTDQQAPAYVVGELASNPFRKGPVPADAVESIDAPPYSSAPQALITEHGLEAGNSQRTIAGWLIESDRLFTEAELEAARDMAADAGLTVEARDQQPGLQATRTAASIAGVLLALGILAMTIGLLRAETAGDLRTLTAAGAGSRVRRALTATTAGALSFLAMVLATATAYLALAAGFWPDLDRLTNVPVAHLLAIAVALPLIATIAGWTLAGREPPAIARRAIE
jgi:putative ABC transport system permease protein